MPARTLDFRTKPVIGMIHVAALPGAPAHRSPLPDIEAQALAEAKVYQEAGMHAVMLENMHDTPYLRGAVGPEIVASLAVIARAVKDATGLPAGVQVLAGANREAIAVALAAGLEFVRVEGFAFAHVADEGLIQSSAAELLRYRRHIGAEHVAVWADIKKKHSSHAITGDVSLAETAHAVEFMRGDAVIVTGVTTGSAPPAAHVLEARRATRLPVIVGSGVTADNLSEFLPHADAFIVGSEFKRDGRWDAPVDPQRVARFMAAHRAG